MLEFLAPMTSKVKGPEVVFSRVFSTSEERGYVSGCSDSWAFRPVASQDARKECPVLIQMSILKVS